MSDNKFKPYIPAEDVYKRQPLHRGPGHRTCGSGSSEISQKQKKEKIYNKKEETAGANVI